MSAKPTLVILAAGMASRYGSMKQTQSFGPSGETIMEYSIYDAINACFGKVVFIIREEFAEVFKNIYEPKLKGKIETEYVYQELTSYINETVISPLRKKPWGTGHALLCSKPAILGDFILINADDFYGTDAFKTAATYFNNNTTEDGALVAFLLGNTLSENGSVSRGVCIVNENEKLISVTERTKIFKQNDAIVFEDENGLTTVENNTPVSMNFWCFRQNVFTYAQKLYSTFIEANKDSEKAEFLLTHIVDDIIKSGDANFNVLKSNAKWFGVTYKEDALGVEQAVANEVNQGNYPNNLWL
jgi:dTDP-glucose pyrophosphorylase